MNDFQRNNIRRQLLRALKLMGAATCAITRADLDLNGMPTGETHQVGSVYGVDYRQVSKSAALLIDIPGVTINSDSAPRFIGVLLQGDAPKAGDMLDLSDGSRRIVSAADQLGVLNLVLGGGAHERTL